MGRCARQAWVATYDLDGHRLEGGFAFEGEEGPASAAGLAVDGDHRVWVADGLGGRVRAFTLFGRPIADVVDPSQVEGHADRAGRLGRPVGVAIRGCDDELEVVVASAGRRRHALQVFQPHRGYTVSLHPEAGPRGAFHDLRGVSWDGERILACEAGAGAVRVYQAGALHWSLHLPVQGHGRFRPAACAALSSGQYLIACADTDASALLLCDPGGRVRRVLAEAGEDEGQVCEPSDVVVEESIEGGPRVVVIDRAGARVQVFTLEGRCYGTFPQLTGS